MKNHIIFSIAGLIMAFSANSQEMVVIQDVIEWTMSSPHGYHFYTQDYISTLPQNWKSPYNYYNGQFYTRYKLLNIAGSEPVAIQFGIWQYRVNPPEDEKAYAETMSSRITLSTIGSVVTNNSSPTTWWRSYEGVDFAKVSSFWRLGINIWKLDPYSVIASSNWGGSDEVWDMRSTWFPVKVEVTVVAVASGYSFSGWDNYGGGGSTTPTLSVAPSSKTVNNAAGSTTFSVTSNVDWTVSENADWLSATKTNATTLTVSYDENTTVTNRSASITLSGTGVSNKTVTLNQEGVPATLDVSPSSKSVDAASGSVMFSVSSNINWNVSESADWLSATRTNSTTLTVLYDANTSVAERSANLILSGTGVSNITVNLTQEGAPAVLSISPSSKSVDTLSGSVTYTVSSNIGWAVSENAEWLSSAKTNDTILTVSYDENTSVAERSAYIVLNGPGVDNDTVTLIQEGVTPVITLSYDSILVSNNAGSAIFSVTSNINWEASDTANWLALIKSNNDTLLLTYDANSTPEVRKTIIILAGPGVDPRHLLLCQEGCSLPGAPVVSASDGTYEDRVTITWESVEGAVDYFVYRNQDLLTTTTELSFDDTNAVSTETLYMVIARNTCGVSISGIDYGNAMVISAIDPDDQGLTIQPVIFPNPSSGDFYFDAGSLFFAGDIEFKVTDMSGSVIFNQHMQISSDESVKLPIELAPGFYVVMIWQGNKIFKEKLMVQ